MSQFCEVLNGIQEIFICHSTWFRGSGAREYSGIEYIQVYSDIDRMFLYLFNDFLKAIEIEFLQVRMGFGPFEFMAVS